MNHHQVIHLFAGVCPEKSTVFFDAGKTAASINRDVNRNVSDYHGIE